MVKTETREQKIEYLLRMTWDSLQSHLQFTHKEIKNVRYVQNGVKMTNVEFEKKTIQEYADMIKTISELY